MNFDEIMDAPEVLPAKKGMELSLEAVKPSFASFIKAVDGEVKKAQDVAVLDESSCAFAVALVGAAKKSIKELEAVKKSLPAYSAARQFIDQVNAFEKMLRDKYQQVVALADPKIVRYRAKVEQDRRIAEAAARRAAAELEEKLRKEAEAENRRIAEEAAAKARANAEAVGASPEEIAAIAEKAAELAKKEFIEPPQVDQQIIPRTDPIIRTETGTTAYSKKQWTYEIIDQDKIPREYLMVDDKQIRNAIKMGVRDIPGLRIFEDLKMNYRT